MGSTACGPCRAGLARGIPTKRLDNVARVVAAWDYDGVARALVLALKVRGRRAAAVALAEGIAERVWHEGSAVDALTWVPGRRRDIRRRGFDHAQRISEELSRLLGIPSTRLLTRVTDPADQAGLGAAARRGNLHGAFAAGPAPGRVAIVDDVVTTGATLSEAGRVLRGAGATHVEGLVACSVQ